MNLFGRLTVLLIVFYSGLFITWFLIESNFDASLEKPNRLTTFSLVQSHFDKISTEPSNTTESGECTVRYYPFNEKELQEIFPYTKYGRCPKSNDAIFSYSNRVLQVTCKNPKFALYSSDSKKNQVFGGGVKGTVYWRKLKESNSNAEFTFVKCSKNSIHALVFNRYKEEIEIKANKIRSNLNPKGKKMNVLILIFDSVSIYSYQRNFNRTIQFLNNLNTQSNYFSYFELEKSATPHHFTINNIAQILFGHKVEDLMVNIRYDQRGNPIIPRTQKDNQKFSIWAHYRNLGYTTMFLHDSVWDYIPMLTGRHIETDHSLLDFWKYNWGVYNWHDFSPGQRCAGSKNSHDLSFDYTYQYFDNYKENNKFAYVHLNAAHENTGNILTVDEDLVSFLNDFMNLIERRGESLALFMLSDHGYKQMRMIRWDYRGYFEVHSPMTHLIFSKDIEKEWNITKNLNENRKKLISRLDINLSLKQLAYFPYNLSVDLNTLNNYKDAKVYSLLFENIPINRTCAEIGVNKEHCLCSWYTPVNQSNEREAIIANVFIDLLDKYFENNAKIILNCYPLENFTLNEMKSFQLQDLESDMSTLYFIHLSYFGIEIKAIGNFCIKLKENMNIIIKETKGLDLPFIYFEVPEGLAFLQVSEVEVDEICMRDICACKEKSQPLN